MTRRQLRSVRFYVFISLFLLAATIAGYGALQKFRYRYNDLGFYESRGWHRSREHSQGNVVAWEWHLIAVKDSVTALTFQMPVSLTCQFSSFSPTIQKPTANATGNGINACDISSEGMSSDVWIVEHFGRPGEVMFQLETTNSSGAQVNCPLPVITKTNDHCPE